MSTGRCTPERPCHHRNYSHLRRFGECWFYSGNTLTLSTVGGSDHQPRAQATCPACGGEQWVQQSLLDDVPPYKACPLCGGPE